MCLLSGGHAWSAAPKSRSAAQRKGPVAWRHPACPGLSDWCLGRSTGGRFRESARSSFTRLERRKSLNRAVTPYFMLRRTSQTRRKPEGHDHKIRCPNGRWPRRRGQGRSRPLFLFRHDEDLRRRRRRAHRRLANVDTGRRPPRVHALRSTVYAQREAIRQIPSTRWASASA